MSVFHCLQMGVQTRPLLRVRLDPLTGQAIAQLALLGKERRLVAQLKTCFARQPGLGRQGKA